MITGLIIGAAVLGAAWRRILGGWLGLRRPLIVASGAVFLVPAWLVWGSAEPWLHFRGGPGLRELVFDVPEWIKAAIVTGAFFAHFTEAVRFSNPWATVGRYTVFGPLPLAALTGFWPALAIGPTCGIAYALGMSYARRGGLYEWSTLCELWVGGVSIAAFVGAPYLASW